MKKIAIITPFLANGGLEKVAVVEAKELSKYFDVTLIVMDSFHVDYPYDGKMIDLQVSLMDRGLFKRLYNILLSTWNLHRLKKANDFDLVISHGELANLPNVFSGGNNNILVVHENRFAAIKDMQGKFVNKIIKYIYSARNVLKIVTVSEGIRESFIKRLGIDQYKIMAIYNPYDVDEIKKLAAEELGASTSIFMHEVLTIAGRLSMQKGQWYLFRIFKELKKQKSNLKLVILGNGEIKEKLIELSNELELKTYSIWSDKVYDDSYDVYFLGFQENPFKYMASSKLFVMTSLWEGFGNTIVEAMACGVPVVSTNCQSGPSEIINPQLSNNVVLTEPDFKGFGVLMPTFKQEFIGAKEELATSERIWIKALQQLLEDDDRLSRYSKEGVRRAEDFRLEIIMSQWKSLIVSILNKGKA